MVFSVLYTVLLLVLVLIWIKWRKSANNLHRIPGPTTRWSDLIQHRVKKEQERSKTHLLFNELRKKYGNVLKIRLADFQDVIVVSDFDLIYKVCKQQSS